ncbi:nuclear nucleic acid-binding protein C1D isoform X1 [Hyaena hyaena]|nr:nuclear nucleic acid-binding protein C1D isoform X1 [Hyaena hyaena]
MRSLTPERWGSVASGPSLGLVLRLLGGFGQPWPLISLSVSGVYFFFSAPPLKYWKLVIMAGEEINEDYPVEIHEYLSTFENSIGAVDEMLKTMMSVSRNELLQKLDPLEQAKVDLVSAYTLNSMFWVYLATQGVNPKEHPVKQELERIRVYMNRVKEITDKKKAGKLDRGAASRFVKNALWEPKPKNASKVANKGKTKN